MNESLPKLLEETALEETALPTTLITASSHLSDEAAFHVSLLSSVKLPFALVPN